jgi:PAS domain S-box-containing protein
MGISAPRLLTDEGSFAAFLFAIELLPVAAYACDADGLIIAFNRAAEEMWGRTPARNHPADRWCGSLGLEMPDGTPISHADCAMAAAVRERTPYLRREVVLRRPDGSRRWALAHACPVIGRDGGVLGATNTLVDITDRRDAEREAVRLGAEAERIAAELMQAKRETERALVTSREIFHQEPHCVKIVDADGVVMDINAAGLNAIEAESIEEIRGRSSLALIAPEWREAYRTALRDAIEFGHSLLEFEILGCRGTRRRMEQRAVRLNGDSTAGGQRLVLAVTRDITHQRAAEAENRMLAEVVRRTRNGAVVTDAQGKVVWANEGFMRLSGYALEEMLGRTPGSLLCGPETDAAETARMSEAVKTGSFCVAELVNYAKDGRRYIVRIEIEPIRSPDGAVTGFMAIETDVTRQREIERELGESEARFRSLVNNIPGVAFRVGVDGTNEFISDGVERITGYPASDFVGNAVRDDASVTHPDDRAMVDAAFAKAIAERASYTIEYRVMHRSGDVRWVSEHGQVLCDERTGEPRHVDGVQLDITDRKRAEESLRAATADLEEAQSLGKLGSWAYDVARARLTWSKQVFRLFDRDESLGEPPLAEAIDLYDPRDVPRLRGHVERALSDGEPFSLVLRTRAGAAARHVRAEARVRRSADGRIATIFGTAMDVTAEVEREAELRDARQHAEAASQSKSEFLANMSHEIRTPMTAILGYADLLAESGVRSSAPPERLEYIETIRRNGEHLLAIINDILDVSKIEAGRMTVETIPIRTEAIVANVLLLMAVKAHAKGIRLGGRVLNEVPAVISSDPVRLRQILVNLIGNAIKFTDVGSVRLEVAFVNDGVPRIRFDVIDTGIGLDAKQMTNLFDAFVQADSSTT